MRHVMKKIVLTVFVALSLFLLSGMIPSKMEVIAADFEKYPSWKGNQLEFSPLRNQSIDSRYRMFSEIANAPEAIDSSKIYVIETALDLYMLSENSMGSNRTQYLSLDYVLGNHIDYYDIVLVSITYRFHPIGFNEPFTGTFDGQGFEISNLYFQTILDEQTYNQTYYNLRYFSMFSVVGTTGVIKNLGLVNPIMIQPIDWGVMQYASPLVGENHGLIEHVYVIDQRREAAGYHVEGDMHLSGLLSVNRGILRDAFIATPRVRALGIFNLTSTSALLTEQHGTIENVYYDDTIFVDRHANRTIGVGLPTVSFQDPVHFSDDWYFNDSYHMLTNDPLQKTQYSLYHTYPILRGLSFDGNIIKIFDATDLLYMNELFKVSGAFRSSHYQIQNDIDMNQISRSAYVASNHAFNGVISGKILDPSDQLYERQTDAGGDILYPSIIDLSIEKASVLGNFAAYGFITSLFGEVKNLNFVNLTLDTIDIEDHHTREMILVGGLTGQLNRAKIHNVHVDVNVIVRQSMVPSTKLYVGGLVGEGSGQIQHASTTGEINFESQLYKASGNTSAVSGIIAHGKGIELSQLVSNIKIIGLTYQSHDASTYYIGGMMGVGHIVKADKLAFLGEIHSSLPNGYINQLYIAGMFGLVQKQDGLIKELYQAGQLTLHVNHVMKAHFAGIANIEGIIDGEQQVFKYQSMTHDGSLNVEKNSTLGLSNAELNTMQLNVSGMFNVLDAAVDFHGLFNHTDFSGDISLLHAYAGLVTANETSSGQIIQAYQLGHLSLTTEHEITRQQLNITAGVLGGSFDLYHLRNEGNIQLQIYHGSSLTSGQIRVLGLFDQVNQNKKAMYLFNGGHITIDKLTSATLFHDLMVSGIAYKHANSNDFVNQGYVAEALSDFTTYVGAMNQVLNAGHIEITGSFHGHTKASGILLFNEGLLTNATNLGHVRQENFIQSASKEVASAGIIYANLGKNAMVKDVLNSGDIIAISKTTQGFAHASGIVVRNDIFENHTFVTSGSLNRHQKITFAVNQGSIYAWSQDATLITIDQESKSKASGILVMGMSTLINVVNYGDIYSKYVASGILGFLFLNRFGALPSYPSLYFGNIMNYGRIREITAFSDDFSINIDANPTRTVQNAFGAIFGKFHSNATSLEHTNYTNGWTFLSVGTTGNKYPLDFIDFKNIYNFDGVSDVLGNASGLSLHQQAIQNGTGNTLVLNIISQMKTLNPNDRSKAPLNQFAMQTQSKTTIYGRRISAYTLDDSSSGIFYGALTSGNTGSEQFVKDYMIELKRQDIAHNLRDRLESNIQDSYFGIYALTSSQGIQENIYLPYHMDIENMHPIYVLSVQETSWLGDPLDTSSIHYRLYSKSAQKNNDPASFVFDLEIIQTDVHGNPIQNGFTLSKPEVDEERHLITYYLPNNYEILLGQTVSTQSTYGYFETSLGDNKGRKVPYVNQGGSWDYKVVGRYKKNLDGTFSEIGPYHTSGMYNMNFTYNSNPKDSSNLLIEDAIYFQNHLSGDGSFIPNVYMHSPHFYYKVGNNNESWINEPGYSIVRSSITYDGRGGFLPYRRVDQVYGPPNYESLFYYVGPNEELVTYDYITQANHQIYETPNVFFSVNFASNEHILSHGATLSYEGQSNFSVISIPKAYGAYDVIYDSVTHQEIDRIQNHYGHVRVYAENYDGNQPNTYRDYEIRIIRTDDIGLTSISALSVDGTSALPESLTNFRDVTATKDIYYKKLGVLGTLEVTYQTMNMPTGTSIIDYVSLINNDANSPNYLDVIDPKLYGISGGDIFGSQIFDQSLGTFGAGTFTIRFEVTNLLPSGSYTLKINLPSQEVAELHFNKVLSSEADIVSMTYASEKIIPTSSIIHHYIPYGIFYHELDDLTQQVNFSNIQDMMDVDYVDLDTMMPSYIEGIEISPFSKIKQMDLNILQTEDHRYIYEIIYEIEAENGHIQTYVHRLEEHHMIASPSQIYQNGGLIGINEDIKIGYTEAPTMRIEFFLDHVYVVDDTVITTTSSMVPFGHDEAILNEDYYINVILGIGFEVDFNRIIPLGQYHFHSVYTQEVYLWGELLTWSFEFDTISMEKIQNNNSLISDILFISDTIYSGFNTIIDYELLTEQSYINYMEYPMLRRINVLPTKGIYYGYHAEEPNYWIVGQVQETNLTYYQPTFTLPEGGIIRRVTDLINVGPEYQSEDLNADFSPFGDTFNFILYRVYAHDYDAELKPLNYTNYYVAVQDITNNIRLNLTIENHTATEISSVFTRITVYQNVTEYNVFDPMIEMSVHASYNPNEARYMNHAFQTSMSGYYVMDVYLPQGFTYYIFVNEQMIGGHAVTLETAILPKRYFVTIVIVESSEMIPWGEQVTYIFEGSN